MNEELQEASNNTDKWRKLRGEIEKLDKRIDGEVYKLYDLTPEEIEIVGEGLE